MCSRFMVLVFPIMLALSGCGLSVFSDRRDNSVIQDWATPSTFLSSSTNVFATKASHRLALIVENGDRLITCAEPSPDVGETFAAAIASSFKAKTEDEKAKLSQEFSRASQEAMATQIAPLLYRTQGLQLYRNAMNSLCIDRLNNQGVDLPGRVIQVPIETAVIIEEKVDSKTKNVTKVTRSDFDPDKRMILNTGSYADLRYLYFVKAVEAIKAELPLMKESQIEFYKNVKSGIDVDTLKKLSSIVKPESSGTGEAEDKGQSKDKGDKAGEEFPEADGG